MPLEVWSTVSAVGTFIVITATAIAAVLQLQHMRAANKVTSIQTFFTEFEGPELRDAFTFVRTNLKDRLADPEFCEELRSGRVDRSKHPEVSICNFFDQWGLYYRDGVIDRESFLRVNAGVIDGFWTLLEPIVTLMADSKYGNLSFQQFEYLTVHARRWLAKNPGGDYPKGEERIPLKTPLKKT